MPERILLIGASGFLGRNLLDALHGAEVELYAISRNAETVDLLQRQYPGIKVFHGSLQEVDTIQKLLLRFKINTVVHLASSLIPSSGEVLFQREMQEIIQPTLALLDFMAAHQLKIVFFSSGGTIYGPVNTTITEQHALRPINHYGWSKLLIEQYIDFLNRTRALPYLILRPANIYGKYQRTRAEQGFIAVALGKYMAQEHIEIWGTGAVVRDYLYSSDLADCVKELLLKKIQNCTLNVGSGEGKSLNEVLRCLEEVVGDDLTVTYLPARAVDVERVVLDISQLRQHCDFRPRPLAAGMKLFWEWVETNNKPL